MESINILLSVIRLLFLERIDYEKTNNDSRDVIKELIELMGSLGKNFKNKNSEKIEFLMSYVLSLVEEFDNNHYDIEHIKQSLSDILGEDKKVDSLVESLKEQLSDDERTESILRIRGIINTHKKKLLLKSFANKLQKDTSNGFKGIGNFNEYIENNINFFEELSGGDVEHDTNIKSSFSISDTESLSETIEKLGDEKNNGFLLKTGFRRLNTVLDGGFRRGELAMVASREGGYKSGFSRSTFIQTLTENAPKTKDPNKKPLAIIYSFEDNERIILKFLYEYFKSCEGKTDKIEGVPSREAAEYIKSEALKNGWYLEILVVDPSNWGFRDVFNNIEYWETQGYEVVSVLLDYISLLNKKGCKGTGTTGSETRELFRRIGNYGRAKDIFMYSPHQSSSAVKSLLDNGAEESEILKLIYGRSYYADSRQISQELDVSILTYPVMHEDEKYLHIAVDKHRGYVLNYQKAFWFYKFPKHDMPIPKDTHTKDMSIESLGGSNTDLF